MSPLDFSAISLYCINWLKRAWYGFTWFVKVLAVVRRIFGCSLFWFAMPERSIVSSAFVPNDKVLVLLQCLGVCEMCQTWSGCTPLTLKKWLLLSWRVQLPEWVADRAVHTFDALENALDLTKPKRHLGFFWSLTSGGGHARIAVKARVAIQTSSTIYSI